MFSLLIFLQPQVTGGFRSAQGGGTDWCSVAPAEHLGWNRVGDPFVRHPPQEPPSRQRRASADSLFQMHETLFDWFPCQIFLASIPRRQFLGPHSGMQSVRHTITLALHGQGRKSSSGSPARITNKSANMMLIMIITSSHCILIIRR